MVAICPGLNVFNLFQNIRFEITVYEDMAFH